MVILWGSHDAGGYTAEFLRPLSPYLTGERALPDSMARLTGAAVPSYLFKV